MIQILNNCFNFIKTCLDDFSTTIQEDANNNSNVDSNTQTSSDLKLLTNVNTLNNLNSIRSKRFQINTRRLLDISLDMLIKSQESSIQYIALTTINRIFDIYVYHNLFYPGFYESCYIPLAKRKLSKEKKYQNELKQLANDLNEFLSQNKINQNKLENNQSNNNYNNNSNNNNNQIDNEKLNNNENDQKNITRKKLGIFSKLLVKTDYCSCNKSENEHDINNSPKKLIGDDSIKIKSTNNGLANKLKIAFFSKNLPRSICKNCNKKIKIVNSQSKLDATIDNKNKNEKNQYSFPSTSTSTAQIIVKPSTPQAKYYNSENKNEHLETNTTLIDSATSILVGGSNEMNKLVNFDQSTLKSKTNLAINCNTEEETATNNNNNFQNQPFKCLASTLDPKFLLSIIRDRLESHKKVDINATTMVGSGITTSNNQNNQNFNANNTNNSNNHTGRIKCMPSARSINCQHHCVAILAARLFALLCNEKTFQLKVCTENADMSFNLIIDILYPNNDPVFINFCNVFDTF